MSTTATGSLPERTPEIGAAAGEARETAGENRPRAAALIITALEEMDAMAAALAEGLVLTVEIASSRAAALRLLQRRAYAVVVLDHTLAEADAEGADLVWKYAGLAIPLQINFALAGSARLEREIRAALARRQREQQLAALAATAELDAELKNAVTGFLLESRLALEEKDLPPGIQSRLRTLAGIASRMRQRLSCAGLVGGGGTPESPTNTQVPLRTARR
ncbi:MAG TPA: hypothetical protein VHZ09_02960 [Acidobacteriaceae bacterium]|jgi:CheY-like chemotaxis protein|nr:hypothetical protein [Acidobacteriaceae bacterium]